MVTVEVREKLNQESIIYSVIKKIANLRSKRIATFYTKECANGIHNVCRVEHNRLCCMICMLTSYNKDKAYMV